jgi:phospholipid/cholesterol/gamma-HCH transport system ATP-binding protein
VNEKGSGCLVEIKGVTLHFGAKMIFNDLSLEIRRGECLVLLGPSGIGKSTLLRLLIKTLNPERGSILFHGADITHLPRAQLNRIRTRIGMVFQSSALVSSMCVSENLALPLRELTTKTEREIATIVEEKLHFVGLENAKDLMPSQLSGGMKKRIAVARALVLNPDLILFDEPTTGLDPVAARQVSELIVDLNRKTGATILVVTHDLHSTFLIATRIAVLDQGRIIEEGPPEAIRHSHDPVVAQFLAAGASDGTEADLTRDRHQLTRDEIGSSQMSKDELIQAAFHCAFRCPRSHQVRSPAVGNLGLVAARCEAAGSGEGKLCSIPREEQGRNSSWRCPRAEMTLCSKAIVTNRVKFRFGDSLGSHLMFRFDPFCSSDHYCPK